MTSGAVGQRSDVDDLDSYASPKAGVSGQFQKPEELNREKSQLDKQEEYIFELADRRLLKGVKGYKPEEKVDKVLCTWREITTDNLIQNSFRIDNPVWTEKQPSFQSPVINFFENIGWPLPKEPETVKASGFWGSRFIKTMKIRARVNPGKDSEAKIIKGKYTLELATVRQFKK